ncbi:lasso RiPP family leader peptide-containing protein [Vibrio cholerae]
MIQPVMVEVGDFNTVTRR